MAEGLLSGVLPYVYSRADALKRRAADAIQNPADYLGNLASQAKSNIEEVQGLQNQAINFDPKSGKLFEVKDPQAFKKLVDLQTETLTGFMPAGIIAGGKAIRNYIDKAPDKAIDMIESSIKLAQKLRKEGKSFEEQVRATNFGFGPDNKLRFEVPDKGANFKVDVNKLADGTEMKVGDVLSHPLLYDFYPELKNKTIRFVKDPKGGAGSYTYGNQVIEVNTANPAFKNPITAVSTVLHEAQHYAQEAENFLKGTDWKKFVKNKDKITQADKEQAIKEYMKTYGEAEARNVQFRFEDPLFEKVGQKTGTPYQDKTKDKVFTDTMGADPYTVDAFKRPLQRDEISSVFYQDPFERTA
jgi:hypothetical protein